MLKLNIKFKQIKTIKRWSMKNYKNRMVAFSSIIFLADVFVNAVDSFG